jgi:hypothetical protein
MANPIAEDGGFRLTVVKSAGECKKNISQMGEGSHF